MNTSSPNNITQLREALERVQARYEATDGYLTREMFGTFVIGNYPTILSALRVAEKEGVYRHAIAGAELTLHDMELSDFPAPDESEIASIYMTLGVLREALQPTKEDK